MNNTDQLQNPSQGKRSLLIPVLVLLVIVLGLTVGYLLYAQSQKNNTVVPNTENIEETQYEFSDDNGAETVDETVDAIEEELTRLNTELDFEDFDSELEMGL